MVTHATFPPPDLSNLGRLSLGCDRTAGPSPFFFSTFLSGRNPSDRFRVRSTFKGL